MSTRRIDDPGSFGGDAIEALVAQLPGATRLSHVLTAGAKHLEAQQLQQRKSADVAGYARGQHPAYFAPNYGQYVYTPGPFNVGIRDLRWLVPRYKRAFENLRAGRAPPPGDESEVMQRLQEIKLATRSMADLDYMRQEDAYVPLLWLAKNGAPAIRSKVRGLLREALHSDRDDAAAEREKIIKQMNVGRRHLGADVLLIPDDWTALDHDILVRIDKEVRGDPTPPTALEAEHAKRRAEIYEQMRLDEMQDNEEEVQQLLAQQRRRQRARQESDRGNRSYGRNPDDSDDEREDQPQFS